MNFSEFVYNERHKLHLTQRELAERSGLSRSKIQSIEHGDYKKYSIRVLKGIAQAFEIPVEDIIDSTEIKVKVDAKERERMLLVKDLFKCTFGDPKSRRHLLDKDFEEIRSVCNQVLEIYGE